MRTSKMLTGLSVFVALMWLGSGGFLEATGNLQRRSAELGCKYFNYDCCMFKDIPEPYLALNGNSKGWSIIRDYCTRPMEKLCCPRIGVREACCSIPIMSFLFDCEGEPGEPHHPPGGSGPAPPPTEYPFPTPPPEEEPPPPPPQNQPTPPPGNEPPPPPPNGPGGSGNSTPQPGENPQTSQKPSGSGPKITLLPPKIPVQPPPDDVIDEPGSTGIPPAPSRRHYQNFDDPSMMRKASNRNYPYKKKKDKKIRPQEFEEEPLETDYQ